jgi:ComF family protein
MWNGLVGLIFPQLCEVCGTPLVRGERLVCLMCLYRMPLTEFWNKKDNNVEKLFWGKIYVEHACSLFFFQKGSDYRIMIHKLKYKGKYNIGLRLGEELGFYLANSPLYSNISVLVPVPLHPEKEKLRGYNQSEYIARGIANILKLPLDTKTLIRVKFTETQTNKNRLDRWSNVQSVFKVEDRSGLEGEHVLLIDDIITTGATTEACASAILNTCNCKLSIASIGYAGH